MKIIKSTIPQKLTGKYLFAKESYLLSLEKAASKLPNSPDPLFYDDQPSEITENPRIRKFTTK